MKVNRAPKNNKANCTALESHLRTLRKEMRKCPIAMQRETKALGSVSLPGIPPRKDPDFPLSPRRVLSPALCRWWVPSSLRSCWWGHGPEQLGLLCTKLSLGLLEAPTEGGTQRSPVRSTQDVSPVRDDELLPDLAGELSAWLGTVHLSFHAPDGDVLLEGKSRCPHYVFMDTHLSRKCLEGCSARANGLSLVGGIMGHFYPLLGWIF